MKKILLVVLLALSLHAEVDFCKDAFNRYLKYDDAFVMALERVDVPELKKNNTLRLKYIEKTISTCGRKWHGRESAIEIRKSVIKISNYLKEH